MDSIYVKLAALFLSFATLATAMKKIADWLEDVASGDARIALVRWLRSVDIQVQFAHWARLFTTSADIVFGSNHWTLSCFLRSLIASAFLTSVGILALFALKPEEFGGSVDAYNLVEGSVLIYGALVTFVANYFSLWETRKLVSFMGIVRFPGQNVALIALDVLLSFLFLVIATLAVNATLVFVDKYLVDHPDFFPKLMTPWHAARNVWQSVTLQYPHPVGFLDAPTSWPTFLATAWLILFLLAKPFIHLGTYLGQAMEIMRRWIDVESKPFKAVGVMFILIVALFYLVVLVPLTIIWS